MFFYSNTLLAKTQEIIYLTSLPERRQFLFQIENISVNHVTYVLCDCADTHFFGSQKKKTIKIFLQMKEIFFNRPMNFLLGFPAEKSNWNLNGLSDFKFQLEFIVGNPSRKPQLRISAEKPKVEISSWKFQLKFLNRKKNSS